MKTEIKELNSLRVEDLAIQSLRFAEDEQQIDLGYDPEVLCRFVCKFPGYLAVFGFPGHEWLTGIRAGHEHPQIERLVGSAYLEELDSTPEEARVGGIQFEADKYVFLELLCDDLSVPHLTVVATEIQVQKLGRFP